MSERIDAVPVQSEPDAKERVLAFYPKASFTFCAHVHELWESVKHEGDYAHRLGHSEISRTKAYENAWATINSRLTTPEPQKEEVSEEDYENGPPCVHCGHPYLSHDDEFGGCKELGVTETGANVCKCIGYDEPFEPVAPAPEGKMEDGWISVEMDLPDDGVPVLIVWSGHTQHLTYMRFEGEWYQYGTDPDIDVAMDESGIPVTRWRPLPAPPERITK